MSRLKKFLKSEELDPANAGCRENEGKSACLCRRKTRFFMLPILLSMVTAP